MSARLEPRVWMPGYWSWLALIGLIAVGLVGNWLVAAGLFVVLLRQVARPLEFLTAYLLVTAGASVIRNEGGRLTIELGLLSALILFMLISYVVSNPDRWRSLPRTSLLLPLLAYVGLSLANYARGLLTGASPRFATLELLPVLALGSALLVANVLDPRRDLKLAAGGLFAMAYGNAALGYYFFSAYHVRSGGVYFMPVPGMIAMLAVNLALRSPRTTSALAWTLLSLPLFLHQFISFTRGYWLGCLAGSLASVLIYARWGRGAGPRWSRAGLVFATIVAMGATAAVGLSLVTGQNLLAMAGSRFGTIAATKLTPETGANVARLAEYAAVVQHIGAAPWFGHGLGYTFTYREPLGFEVLQQWYTHEVYLFVWLKQGLVGLAVFVWMLITAIVFCVRGARHSNQPWDSAWSAAAAASTVFLAVLDMSNFHLSVVNGTFPLALLWGGAMAMGREGSIYFRWTDPAAHALPAKRAP